MLELVLLHLHSISALDYQMSFVAYFRENIMLDITI
jgi:hypothetical protein